MQTLRCCDVISCCWYSELLFRVIWRPNCWQSEFFLGKTLGHLCFTWCLIEISSFWWPVSGSSGLTDPLPFSVFPSLTRQRHRIKLYDNPHSKTCAFSLTQREKKRNIPALLSGVFNLYSFTGKVNTWAGVQGNIGVVGAWWCDNTNKNAAMNSAAFQNVRG